MIPWSKAAVIRCPGHDHHMAARGKSVIILVAAAGTKTVAMPVRLYLIDAQGSIR